MPVPESVLLGLPPAPQGYCAADDDFIGSWSSVALRAEQAGFAFFEKYEVVQQHKRSESGESETKSPKEQSGSSASVTETEGEQVGGSNEPRKKKGLKDGSITGKVKDAIDNDMDLYALLCSTPAASVEELKKNYRKLCLIYHPDKRSGDGTLSRTESVNEMTQLVGDLPNPKQMTDEEIQQHFIAVQTAFEILSDDVCRKQYDSSLPFDEELPKASDITPENFFEVCSAAFEKESKWAVRKPVPRLGDMNTPITEVKKFYRFWADFESWRDFSQYGEYNIEEAESRDERRWMQKENWRIVSKYVKQERQRVISFVALAESKDPRIIADRQAEMKRKEDAKQAKQANLRKAQLQAQEAARRVEEERKAVEAEIAKVEAAKKQAEKSKLQDLRKRIRKYHRQQCQVVDYPCDFTLDDLNTFCLEAPADWLSTMLNRIEAALKVAESAEKKPEVVARTIRAVMSEYNSTRYKTTLTIPKPQAVSESRKKVQKEWTPEMLSLLSKALVKFPGGYPDRWGHVASFVGNGITPEEAVSQAKNLSTNRPTVINTSAFELSQKRIGEDKKKINAPIDKRDPSTIPDWTSEQQTALEKALAKHPASLPPQQRWSQIAAEVPNKTAKECLTRFKEIRDAILAATKEQQQQH